MHYVLIKADLESLFERALKMQLLCLFRVDFKSQFYHSVQIEDFQIRVHLHDIREAHLNQFSFFFFSLHLE